MSGVSFGLNVKRTHAPLNGEEVIIGHNGFPAHTRKVKAIAGHSWLTADGLDARLAVLLAPETSVRISPLSIYSHKMFTVYAVYRAAGMKNAQSWVAYGLDGRIRQVDITDSIGFLGAMEERYGQLATQEINPDDPLYGRFQIEAPDIHQDNILNAARLAVASFAGFVD